MLKRCGSLPYIFISSHAFEFRPSKTTPGYTTFVQYEDFSVIGSHYVVLVE